MTFSRIAVIYNPRSGRPRERLAAVDRFRRLLEAEGRTVDVCPTQRPNHATDLAREEIAQGADLIIAHGGDGTMNEVLQAVVGTDSTLGFWPGGTANVLAAELKFPRHVDQVVQRVLRGHVKPVTVGRANDRYFLLMAGVGLDAAVAAAVDPNLKQRVGKAAFAVSALRFVWDWNLPPVKVEIPGEELVGRFVVAGNAHSYGGGFKLTPAAQLDDPTLDICVFDAPGRLRYIGFGIAAALGMHRGLPGVTYRKVRTARITPVGDPSPVQLDGEVVPVATDAPLQLEAIPDGVKLLV